MFDYEGSRAELLKLLAQFGEEPAFIARARAPQVALEALLSACEAKRAELLQWPTFHLSVLAHQVGQNWPQLRPLLAEPNTVTMLQELHAQLHSVRPVHAAWVASDRTALRRFLQSAERFNRNWQRFLDGLDLEPANQPRRDFNQFYVVEKACAFGSERVTEGFEPLEMIDRAYLYQRFPLLVLPKLA